MSSLKALKLRIKSVKSTQKITKAMQMVAASKFRRSKAALESNLHYAESLRTIVSDVAREMRFSGSSSIWTNKETPKSQLLIVISANRGLCGPFNSRIIQEATEWVEKQTIPTKVWCIGSKILHYFVKQHKSTILSGSFARLRGSGLEVEYQDIELMKKNVSFHDAVELGMKLVEEFQAEQFDSCTILYSKFITTLSQKPCFVKLLPFEDEGAYGAGQFGAGPFGGEQNTADSIPYNFEPDPQEILDTIMKRFVIAEIFEVLLNSQSSENVSRMTAMDDATRNASEMIKDLTLVMNRTRQATITRELIEIISGAEAL